MIGDKVKITNSVVLNQVTVGAECVRSIWTWMCENLTLLYANNKGTDQPAHTHSLVSPFVIHYLSSVVVNLAPG